MIALTDKTEILLSIITQH